MTRFYYIDQSLTAVGGHHYEWAMQLLDAAGRLGLETVVGANRQFDPAGHAQRGWRIEPVFKYTLYSDRQLFPWANLADRVRHVMPAAVTVAQSLMALRYWPRRRRLLRDFVSGIRAMFDRVPPEPGDQVFIPNASAICLSGVEVCLRSAPKLAEAVWHFLFHLPLMLGREPDYPSQQGRTRAMRRALRRALCGGAARRLRFYTTTEQLRAQYQGLGEADFHVLPYPVRDEFRTCGDQLRTSGPRQVVFAGQAGATKGYQFLPRIVADLWPDYVQTGKARFVIQSNVSFKTPQDEGQRQVVSAINQLSALPGDKVTLHQRPLTPDEYGNLIRQSDIGLLPYDPALYYTGCSGVLAEMLSAGVPVIVLAGSWLSEQIAEDIFRHQEALRQRLRIVESGTIKANVSESASLLAPEQAKHLFVETRWLWPTTPGAYIRLQLEAFDADGQSIGRQANIVGHRSLDMSVTALFPLEPGSRTLALSWSNAFHRGTMRLADVRIDFAAADGANGSCPLGAVGLIAADHQQIPDLLRNMIDHYDHFRRTAVAFARQWTSRHNAVRFIEQLVAKEPASGERRSALPLPAPGAAQSAA